MRPEQVFPECSTDMAQHTSGQINPAPRANCKGRIGGDRAEETRKPVKRFPCHRAFPVSQPCGDTFTGVNCDTGTVLFRNGIEQCRYPGAGEHGLCRDGTFTPEEPVKLGLLRVPAGQIAMTALTFEYRPASIHRNHRPDTKPSPRPEDEPWRPHTLRSRLHCLYIIAG